jgi:predicted DNA-binding transcriptional regulator AlpA
MDPWLEDDIEEGAAPWALGDDEVEPLDRWDGDEGLADDWLDARLARAKEEEPALPMPAGASVLRAARPARRRRADPDAAADLPASDTPGYIRDRRGTWRYTANGRAVPGARDLTLRSLYHFHIQRACVLIPAQLVRTEAELAWCMAWKEALTLTGSTGVLRVPVDEWERRADIPFGLWAPELAPTRLLAIGDVARLAGVTSATITAYLSRRRMPPPMRLGHTPVWSRPVIAQWLASRPGQGRRA